MCGRYVITKPILKSDKFVKSFTQVQDKDNYNAHPMQNLPVVRKYTNGNDVDLTVPRIFKLGNCSFLGKK